MKNLINLKANTYLKAFSPLTAKQAHINKSAIIISVFLFLFLILLKPLFFNFVSSSSLIQISFFSTIIPISIGWMYYSNLSKKVNALNWTLYDDIYSFSLLFFSTLVVYLVYVYCVVKFFYVEDLKLHNWDFNRNVFIETMPYFFIIGIILFILMKFIDFIRYAKKINKEVTDDISYYESVVEVKNFKTDLLTFKGKNKEDILTINRNDFLFLESSGHYIKIYHIINGTENKITVLRNSINAIIKDLKTYDNILQCHRSYIINTTVDYTIEGNSKKAAIILKDVDYKIPLSRENYNLLLKNKEKTAHFVK